MKQGIQLIQEINTCVIPTGTAAFWWLGQLGYVVKLGTVTIYLDPFLSDWADRKIPSLLQPAEITNADFIIGSHDHIDHIDRNAWPQIAISSPQTKFVVPSLLVPELATKLQISEARFVGLDDGVTVQLTEEMQITGVAAAHEFLDRDPETGCYPYMGCVIQGNGCILYHAGDTCIYEGLYQKLRAFGKLDAMFLPINGRDGIRYRNNIIGNMTWQEAVDLAGTIEPGLVVPGHYEMFDANSVDPALFIAYLNAKYPEVEYWVGGHGELVEIKCWEV